MTLQVEIGQKLNNGLTQVNTYEVPNGTNNKYAPKSFAVLMIKSMNLSKNIKTNQIKIQN